MSRSPIWPRARAGLPAGPGLFARGLAASRRGWLIWAVCSVAAGLVGCGGGGVPGALPSPIAVGDIEMALEDIKRSVQGGAPGIDSEELQMAVWKLQKSVEGKPVEAEVKPIFDKALQLSALLEARPVAKERATAAIAELEQAVAAVKGKL